MSNAFSLSADAAPAARLFRSTGAAIAVAAFLSAVGVAEAQLRIVSWNISNYSGGRIADIQTTVYGVAPNGLQMRPDVICAQEFISNSALSAFLSALNTAPGSPGDWAAAPFPIPQAPQSSLPDTQSVMFYRTSRVTFLGTRTIALGSTDTTNQPRNTYRHDIRPVGYSNATTAIAMYNVHLKAGSAASDEARRLIESQRIRNNAEGLDTNGAGSGLPAGYNFMVLGDFNVQNSNDDSYVELIGSQANNAGRLFDPIASPGTWTSNAAFRFIHTQDPSTSAGMDDRYDFVLVSGGLINGSGLEYVGNPAIPYSTSTWNDPNHSYRAWGNDGSSCCNSPLNTSGNSMVGDIIAQAIKNCATTSGGHIPVFVDVRVPGKVSASTLNLNFGTVPVGALATQNLTVTNAGNTALWTVNGVASLVYTLAASSGFTAPGNTFTETSAPGGFSHILSMNTSTPGVKTGTITINSNDPDQPALVVTVSGEVVAANQPPVANAGPDQTVTDINRNGVESVVLDGSASTDPQGSGTITEYRWTLGPTVLAAGPSPTANVSLPLGVNTVTLRVTDAGALSSTDTVQVTVEPGCVADTDDGTGSGTPDGGVGIEDLLFYLGLYDAGSAAADVDDGTASGIPDGGVGIEDLLYYLGRYDLGC